MLRAELLTVDHKLRVLRVLKGLPGALWGPGSHLSIFSLEVKSTLCTSPCSREIPSKGVLKSNVATEVLNKTGLELVQTQLAFPKGVNSKWRRQPGLQHTSKQMLVSVSSGGSELSGRS